MTPGADRVAVMVIRVWIEPSAGSLRARLTSTVDVNAPSRAQDASAAASADQVIAAVHEWIEAFLADSESPP